MIVNRTVGQSQHYKYKQQIDSIIVNDTLPWRYQLCATDFSMIGEYRRALETWDEPRKDIKTKPLKEGLVNTFLKYKPQHADKYIIEQAQKTSLLIINEAHHQPCHRVFVESLLKDLYKAGYRYIGFETLGRKDSLLNKRKYPIETTGYYSNEPSFGNLIRSSLLLGYTIFPYEANNNANGKQREIEEANNIKAYMDKANNSGKYIIFCGFDHVIEDSTQNDWELAMAGRLKALTGINPLTIDQVQLTETSNPDFDNPYRRLVTVDYPAVLIDSLGNTFNKVNKTKSIDLNLYHPDTKYQKGRPDWLFRVNYKPYNIVSKITIDFPCIAYAYIKSEKLEGVPVDIISLDKKDLDKCLILPDNRKFVIVCKNQKGQVQYIKIK
ncbi:MAG: hypothetical protein ABI315_05775 [Bacteroidia bacterium]